MASVLRAASLWILLRAGSDESSPEIPISNSMLTELLGLAILVLNLLFALALKHVEKFAARKHVYLGMTFRVLYKEFMSLGFISLTFTFIEIYVHPDPTVIHSFEFAHIFLFMLAVINMVAVGCTTYTSLRISRRWKMFQQIQTAQYEEDRQDYDRLFRLKTFRNNWLWQWLLWAGFDLRSHVRFAYLHEEMMFHDLRIQFLHYRDMPSNFNFSKYLRHIKSTMFVELVEIQWASWLILLVVFAADCIRRAFYESSMYDMIIVTCLSVANVLLVYLVLRKIKHIYWELTKHPGLYFENIEEVLSKLDSPSGPRQPGDIGNLNSHGPDMLHLAQTGANRASTEEQPPENFGAKISSVSEESAAGAVAALVYKRRLLDQLYSDPSSVLSMRSEADPSINLTGSLMSRADSSKTNLTAMSAGTMEIQSPPRKRSFDSVFGSRRDSLIPGSPAVSEVDGNGSVNKTIHQRAMEVEEARAVESPYPNWMTILIPRLNRKSSPAEKLFWFGSSLFFGWLCQMVLLFSVILVTLVITDLIFQHDQHFIPLYFIMLAVTVITFVIVQLILAVVMKKYTIVLNAAHLVEEEMSSMAAASEDLGQGGPDWGGMWQMAEMMKASQQSSEGNSTNVFSLPPQGKGKPKTKF